MLKWFCDVSVLGCLCVCVCMCVFACVFVCLFLCVRVCVCVYLCFYFSVFVCACKCNVVVMVFTDFQSAFSREAHQMHLDESLRLCFMIRVSVLVCLHVWVYMCLCACMCVCVFVFVFVFRDLQKGKVYTRVSACWSVCVGSRLLL